MDSRKSKPRYIWFRSFSFSSFLRVSTRMCSRQSLMASWHSRLFWYVYWNCRWRRASERWPESLPRLSHLSWIFWSFISPTGCTPFSE